MEQQEELLGLEMIDEMDIWDARTEVYYLDENNNFVPEEKAVKRITQYFDAQGNLLQEFIAYRMEEDPEENTIYEEIFTDDDGNEVEEAVATYVIYRRYENGQLVCNERVEILRDDDEEL